VPCKQADVRRFALSLPDSEEGSHQGHPDFRRGGRVFATLHPDGATAMVKLPPSVQRELVGAGDVFRPAAGAWGRAGCTLVTLERAPIGAVRDAVQAAWEFAVAIGRRRAAKK